MQLRTIAKSLPASLAVGPRQYAYLFQGHGERPTRVDLTNSIATDMGIDAPSQPAAIVTDGDPKKYVARIDVLDGGSGYTAAPAVSITGGGTPDRKARARSYLSGDAVGDFSVLDYGSGYESTPTVTLSDARATTASLTAVLDSPTPVTPTPTPVPAQPTAIGKWSVVQIPVPFPELPGALATGGFLLPNGSTGPAWSNVPDLEGNLWTQVAGTGEFPVTRMTFQVDIAGPGSSRARLDLSFGVRLMEFGSGKLQVYRPYGAPTSITLRAGGSGYFKDEPYDIRLASMDNTGKPTTTPLLIRCYSNESEDDTTPTAPSTTYYPIKSVEIDKPGAGYVTPPVITIDDTYGTGGLVEAVLTDGKVTAVNVLNGGAYTKPPRLSIGASGAKAVAIVRAHIRGRYDCFYRYVDDTPPERGGPICSSLSPVRTIDAGDGVGELQWTVPAPPVVDGRVLTTELWRTTSDQAYTVYRVAEGVETFVDTISDQDLVDFERPGYAAMPVLLPNGALNANRFGVPPSDMAVGVMFQDRLWMAVDTSGNSPNVLRFSEYNEPESCPDVNELVLQTNVKGHDHITALIPYGGSLGVMQSRHAYRLTYVSQPVIDASLQIAAYRGCLNQRCWDEYEGLVYCLDSSGVYVMDQGGQVLSISDGIRDVFSEQVDYSKSKWFSVTADRKARCLRVAVRLVSDGPGDYPTRFYCYSFSAKGWWQERYPAPLVGSANIRDAAGVAQCVYGSEDGRLFALNSGNRDIAIGTIGTVVLTNKGSGYTTTPRVTVNGDGDGAVVEAAVGGDGRLLGLYLRTGGFGYTTATLTIEPPAGGITAAGTCTIKNGQVDIPCWYKSGNMEYPHDSLPVEMPDKNRNVAMLFTPTDGPCQMKLRLFYNNSPFPRINVAARDRGTGVVYETEEPAVTLDMDADLLPGRISSGVCRALFSSHTVDDIQGNDRHVAFELYCLRGDAGLVQVHGVDVFGVVGA